MLLNLSIKKNNFSLAVFHSFKQHITIYIHVVITVFLSLHLYCSTWLGTGHRLLNKWEEGSLSHQPIMEQNNGILWGLYTYSSPRTFLTSQTHSHPQQPQHSRSSPPKHIYILINHSNHSGQPRLFQPHQLPPITLLPSSFSHHTDNLASSLPNHTHITSLLTTALTRGSHSSSSHISHLPVWPLLYRDVSSPAQGSVNGGGGGTHKEWYPVVFGDNCQLEEHTDNIRNK